MKQSVNEGLFDYIIKQIKKGYVDSKTKKLMKDDPEVAQAVKAVKASFDRLNKAMDNL